MRKSKQVLKPKKIESMCACVRVGMEGERGLGGGWGAVGWMEVGGEKLSKRQWKSKEDI